MFPYYLAERVGFEPTVPCGTPDFESGTIDHSATSPGFGCRCGLLSGVRDSIMEREGSASSAATTGRFSTAETQERHPQLPVHHLHVAHRQLGERGAGGVALERVDRVAFQ